jgi:hypothetical protein
MIKYRKLEFNLRLIVIDSLSSLFMGIPQKNNQMVQLMKELLYYFKTLTKKYFICVMFTNNSKDSYGVSRVSELKNLVGEPVSWAVDK